jgi:uncharacterized protein
MKCNRDAPHSDGALEPEDRFLIGAAMPVNHNKQTIADIYDALAKGDTSVFAKACHPDYVWRFPGHYSWAKRFEGQDVIQLQLIMPLYALFATQYKAHAINIMGEGDCVVAEVRGDVMTKTGQRYNNEYCFVFKFKNSKIIEVVEYCDTDLIERVLGKYEDAVSSYYKTSLQNEPSKI